MSKWRVYDPGTGKPLSHQQVSAVSLPAPALPYLSGMSTSKAKVLDTLDMERVGGLLFRTAAEGLVVVDRWGDRNEQPTAQYHVRIRE
ncbi:MAG: hypothetical protein IPF95_18015 [Flavobacteriales bacterium]|nr:hypothetical protein [Flavobacteriales bacterium]